MSNINPPPPASLPSPRALRRSAFIAVFIAIALIVVAVLPAERGIDPTGIGRVIGLTQMGEIKMALAQELLDDSIMVAKGRAKDSLAALTTAASAARPTAPPTIDTSNTTSLTLRPNQGREIKLAMRKGARVAYSWSTDDGVVNYDLHADTVNAPKGFYHGYEKGTGKAHAEGVLVAAFDGTHGWFWRNRGTRVLTVTLRTKGDYSELREIK